MNHHQFLFLSFFFMLGLACNSDESVEHEELSDPIILDQTLEYGSFDGNAIDISLDEESTPEIQFTAKYYGSTGGTSFNIDVEVLDSNWSILAIDKTDFICEDTIINSGNSLILSHSCHQDSNFNSIFEYESINLFESDNLAIPIMGTRINSGRVMLYKSINLSGLSSGPGEFNFYNYSRGAFTTFEEGYIIFENESQPLKMKIKLIENDGGLFLEKIEEL